MISRRKLLVGGATLLAAPAIVQRYSWAKPPPLLTADLAAFIWMSSRPPKFTVPAWFPVRVNKGHWFADQLLFSGIFNGAGRVPLWTNGFSIGNNGYMPSDFGNPGTRFGGNSLIGGAQYSLGGSALNMHFSGTSGAMLGHFSRAWNYNDGAGHILFEVGAPIATNVLQINKFSDSVIYAGWGGSSDTRIITSAAFMGANDGGYPATMGLSWTAAGGTVGYYNSQVFGTNGATPNSSTATFDTFTVSRTSSLPWFSGNAYDAIYGLHLFNRSLTASEQLEYNADPCCGFEPDYDLLMGHNTTPTAVGRSRGLIVN